MLWIAETVVIGFGLWLIGLAAFIFITPGHATNFLNGFASSALAHYTEMVLRLFVGIAFVVFAPMVRYSDIFWFFGWVILVSTVGLLLIPWKWHRAFAQRMMPPVIRYMKYFAVASFIFGALVLIAATRG